MKRSREHDMGFEQAPKRLETEFRSLNLDPERQAEREKEQIADDDDLDAGNEPSLIIDPKFLKIPSFILEQSNQEDEYKATRRQNQLALVPKAAEQDFEDSDDMHLSD